MSVSVLIDIVVWIWDWVSTSSTFTCKLSSSFLDSTLLSTSLLTLLAVLMLSFSSLSSPVFKQRSSSFPIFSFSKLSLISFPLHSSTFSFSISFSGMLTIWSFSSFLLSMSFVKFSSFSLISVWISPLSTCISVVNPTSSFCTLWVSSITLALVVVVVEVVDREPSSSLETIRLAIISDVFIRDSENILLDSTMFVIWKSSFSSLSSDGKYMLCVIISTVSLLNFSSLSP